MPTVSAERLNQIGAALLRAAGASAEEAADVSTGCINANLAGHDSHGIIAIPTYIDRIKARHIVPGAPFKIVQESPATTVIDGHWGFGFHVNKKAMQLTIDKAKTDQRRRDHRVSAVACRPSRRLSADGGARGHDRHRHR
jgi:LDH2 family malate/lactate/ureidoglycolate dehydrogenase